MKNYALTIRVPFESFDDIEARKVVEAKLREIEFVAEAELKLQEVFKNSAPRKINLRM